MPVFLQVGMRYYNKRTNKYHNPIVNLDKLWTLVGEEVRFDFICSRAALPMRMPSACANTLLPPAAG